MEMRVLAYDEGKFIISKELTSDYVKSKQVVVNIAPVLKYRDEDDVVGALLNIDFTVDDNTILFLGMVVSIYVENIKDILKEKDETKKKNNLIPVWNIALGMARGILVEKTKDTPLAQQFLPIVNLEKFADVAILSKVPRVD